MLFGKVKLAMALLLAPAVLCQNACRSKDLQPTPQNGIVGKWRSADGSYVVEFLPTGNCSARYRMQGRELGGPCTYSADKDTITIHYYGPNAHPQDAEPDASATWHYSLDGDTLNVGVQGNSLALQRCIEIEVLVLLSPGSPPESLRRKPGSVCVRVVDYSGRP